MKAFWFQSLENLVQTLPFLPPPFREGKLHEKPRYIVGGERRCTQKGSEKKTPEEAATQLNDIYDWWRGVGIPQSVLLEGIRRSCGLRGNNQVADDSGPIEVPREGSLS